jgi:LPS sulfotransferase NodH
MNAGQSLEGSHVRREGSVSGTESVAAASGRRYSEGDVNSALLDQPAFDGQPRRVMICSTPRSGSYMLCRHMINAGLGVPHEYFNPIIVREIAPRLGLAEAKTLHWRPRSLRDRLHLPGHGRRAEVAFLQRYLEALVPIRCQSGVFAAKLHFDHFHKLLYNAVGLRLFQNAIVVHLYRENPLAQAVSTHFANLTGRWGIDDAITTKPAVDPDFFDVPAIDRTVQGLAEHERGWRDFFTRQRIQPVSVSYERMCRDPHETLRVIADRIGVNQADLSWDYQEPADGGEYKDPSLPSKSEVIRHYLAATGGTSS